MSGERNFLVGTASSFSAGWLVCFRFFFFAFTAVHSMTKTRILSMFCASISEAMVKVMTDGGGGGGDDDNDACDDDDDFASVRVCYKVRDQRVGADEKRRPQGLLPLPPRDSAGRSLRQVGQAVPAPDRPAAG